MANTVELQNNDLTEDSHPVSAPDPMLGRFLLHYRIKRRLGQGGMSVVYEGRDEKLGRDVAIKVLHPFLAEKAECRARLVREARAVARLENENILRIFDASAEPIDPSHDSQNGGNKDGFLVTELVPGSTLREFAERHRLHELPELGGLIIWQLARALAHAHEQGVIHRDLKPENVMVRQDGVLKLMDFGIAQIVDAQSLTITGTLLGSPAHMAPECIDGNTADARSDLFSLGTVLYWLTTGSLPFSASTPHALLKAIVDGKWMPPQQHQPRISDALARVIHKSMARQPDDRYASATEMADALAKALTGFGLTPTARLVNQALSHPSKEMPEISKTVCHSSLMRAEELLNQEKPARALSVLARVLAEHPNDEAAAALLTRAEAGADALGVEREPVVKADENTSQPFPQTMAFADTMATETLPQKRFPWTAILVSMGIVGLVGAVIFIADVADRMTNGAGGRAQEQSIETAPPMSYMSDKPSQQNEKKPKAATDNSVPKNTAQPEQLEKTTSNRLTKKRYQPAPPKSEKLASRMAVVEMSRVVEVKVNTWANIAIDGAIVAQNTKRHQLKLKPGKYALEVTNPAALTHRQTIQVPSVGSAPPINVVLKRKPAELKVFCNIKDADIAIRVPGASGGKSLRLLGRAGQSVARPLRVPLEGGATKREYEVIVHKSGYAPQKYIRTFSTGDLVTLRVVLEPSK